MLVSILGYNKKHSYHNTAIYLHKVRTFLLFVPTVECDAHQNFKSAYINASDEQIKIIKSPVGMPGRAIETNFLTQTERIIKKCQKCMPNCNPKEIPYCISEGLINSVQGRDGLIFSGANLNNVNKMTTVKEVIDKLIR